MKELIEFFMSHESLILNIAIISFTVAFASLFYLPKLLDILNRIDVKLTDIERIHEFFISKLVTITFISIEDLIILKDSLSESSITIKKLIEQNIISGKYNINHDQQYINNLQNQYEKYPVNPKHLR